MTEKQTDIEIIKAKEIICQEDAAAYLIIQVKEE